MKQLRKYTHYPQGVESHKDLLDYILNKAKDLKIVSYNTVDNRVGYVDTNVDTQPIDYSKVAMFFENVGTDDAVISVKKNNTGANTISLEISIDNTNYETWGDTSTTALSKTIGAGERLYIRNAENVGYFSISLNVYNKFSSTGANIIVGGNIMSLGYKNFENKYTIEQSCAYSKVFRNMTNLIDASKLVLPATTLASNCYSQMFDGCTSLTTAPELPATTLVYSCYMAMFRDCTSLTTTPELPATTLASECYSNMFNGCTSLTTAPELPATTLKESCYSAMFYGCTSLTTAPAKLPVTTLATGCYKSMFNGCTSLTTTPELPATTLTDNCYSYMFKGCSNLNYIKAMFTTTPNNLYTNSWLSGVASTGTFVKNANATWDVSGDYGIPEGWTVETATA